MSRLKLGQNLTYEKDMWNGIGYLIEQKAKAQQNGSETVDYIP